MAEMPPRTPRGQGHSGIRPSVIMPARLGGLVAKQWFSVPSTPLLKKEPSTSRAARPLPWPAWGLRGRRAVAARWRSQAAAAQATRVRSECHRGRRLAHPHLSAWSGRLGVITTPQLYQNVSCGVTDCRMPCHAEMVQCRVIFRGNCERKAPPGLGLAGVAHADDAEVCLLGQWKHFLFDLHFSYSMIAARLEVAGSPDVPGIR